MDFAGVGFEDDSLETGRKVVCKATLIVKSIMSVVEPLALPKFVQAE